MSRLLHWLMNVSVLLTAPYYLYRHSYYSKESKRIEIEEMTLVCHQVRGHARTRSNQESSVSVRSITKTTSNKYNKNHHCYYSIHFSQKTMAAKRRRVVPTSLSSSGYTSLFLDTTREEINTSTTVCCDDAKTIMEDRNNESSIIMGQDNGSCNTGKRNGGELLFDHHITQEGVVKVLQELTENRSETKELHLPSSLSSDEHHNDHQLTSLLSSSSKSNNSSNNDCDHDEDEDRDDQDYFAALVGSITSEDQKQIMEGFESYMENKHNNNNNNTASPGSTTTTSIGANNNTLSSSSSTTKSWLHNGSMSSSYSSTNRYGNRFDPNFQTLEGVRKNLYEMLF